MNASMLRPTAVGLAAAFALVACPDPDSVVPRTQSTRQTITARSPSPEPTQVGATSAVTGTASGDAAAGEASGDPEGGIGTTLKTPTPRPTASPTPTLAPPPSTPPTAHSAPPSEPGDEQTPRPSCGEPGVYCE